MLNAINSYYSNYANPYAAPAYLRNLGNLYGTNTLFGTTGLNASNGLGGVYGLQSSLAINNLSRTEESTKVRLSDLGRMKSGLDSLNQGLQGLRDRDSLAPFKAMSSDERVARSEAGKLVRTGDQYVLNVTQLAQAQTLTGSALASGDSTVGTGVLTIELGATGSSFISDRSTTVYINSGNNTLSGIATAINRANAGVTATVLNNNDGARLQLLASETGTQNTLRIRINDNDSNDTDTSGLSQLAYDPLAAAGSGRNLTQTVAAADAAFSIDGTNLAAQANTTGSAISGVTLNLTGTGTARIDVARDGDAFSAGATRLVEQFNAYLKTSEGADQFGVGAKIARQLQTVISDSAAGLGNDRLTLDELGIRRNASTGRLGLDRATLDQAFAANPETATQLLSEVAGSLQDIAGRNTGSTSELQLNSRQLQQSLQAIDVQRSLLYNYDEPMVNGMAAGSLSSLLSYMPAYPPNSPIARYLAVAGL